MAVGRYTFERDGTITAIQWGGTQTATTNNIPVPTPPALVDTPDTKTGTYTVDEDTCTITMVLDGYNRQPDRSARPCAAPFADNGKRCGIRGSCH
jgi:hypothetical protein